MFLFETHLIIGFITCALIAGSIGLYMSNYRRSAASAASMALLTGISALVGTEGPSLASFFAIEVNILATMAGMTFFWFAVGNRSQTRIFLALAYLASSSAFGIELLANLFTEPEYAQIMTASVALWLMAVCLLIMAATASIRTKLCQKHRKRPSTNVVPLRKRA